MGGSNGTLNHIVSKFLFFNILALMASNGGQYDPRAQAMEEVHFERRCIVCCMVALSPFIWNNSTSLGLILCILTWTTPHGLNVTSAIPPFIYSVGHGNQFMLLDPDVFFAPSSVVDSSNFSYPPFLCHLIFSILFCQCFKMGRRPLCPDGKKKRPKKDKKEDGKGKEDKKDKKPTKRHSDGGDRGGSTHANQSIGNFTADIMAQCIAEIHRVEAEAKAEGKVPLSRNKIARSFGLSPSTVSKRMTGKVTGMGPQSGGPRRGRVFAQGKFQATQ